MKPENLKIGTIYEDICGFYRYAGKKGDNFAFTECIHDEETGETYDTGIQRILLPYEVKLLERYL